MRHTAIQYHPAEEAFLFDHFGLSRPAILRDVDAAASHLVISYAWGYSRGEEGNPISKLVNDQLTVAAN